MVDTARLSRVCTVRQFIVDEFVFNQGDPGHDMYILLSGQADVLSEVADGKQIPVHRLYPGDFFGEMSLLEGAPRSASIQIVEEAITLVVDERSFPSVIEQDPVLAMKITKELSRRLRKQTDRVGQLEIENWVLKVKIAAGGMAKQGGLVINGGLKHSQDEGNMVGNEEENKGTRDVGVYTEQLLDSEIGRAQFDSILPKGHRVNSTVVMPDHEAYLFNMTVVCPVCLQTFTEQAIRSSKLKLVKEDKDFRRRYHNFESLWYSVWTCPHCYYANFSSNFQQITEQQKIAFRQNSSIVKKQVSLKAPQSCLLDEVFIKHYLAVNWFKTVLDDPEKLGKLWLHLAWLYDDTGDVRMRQIATKEAFLSFRHQYCDDSRQPSPEKDQYLSVMLGELSLRFDNQKETINLQQVAVPKGGSKYLTGKGIEPIVDINA